MGRSKLWVWEHLNKIGDRLVLKGEDRGMRLSIRHNAHYHGLVVSTTTLGDGSIEIYVKDVIDEVA